MISPRVKIIITEGDEEARANKHTFVNVFCLKLLFLQSPGAAVLRCTAVKKLGCVLSNLKAEYIVFFLKRDYVLCRKRT
jgi:hypothetical protein